MKRLTFKDQCAGLIRDAVGEVQSHPLGCREPEFDIQRVVVSRGSFVAEMRFDDWENVPLFLELKTGCTNRAEKFSARAFKNVQVTGVIDVVADGAIGVSHATLMDESFVAHAQASLRFFNTCTVEAALLSV